MMSYEGFYYYTTYEQAFLELTTVFTAESFEYMDLLMALEDYSLDEFMDHLRNSSFLKSGYQTWFAYGNMREDDVLDLFERAYGVLDMNPLSAEDRHS